MSASWPWHVLGPDEPAYDAADPAWLVLDYDIDVYEVWPPGPCDGPIGSWVTGSDRPLDVRAMQAVAELRSLPGAMLVLAGGWLPRWISRGLAGWTARYTKRGDLRFHWHAGTCSAVLWSLRQSSRTQRFRASRPAEWITLWAVPEIQGAGCEPDPTERLVVDRTLAWP